jgi:hypothetical protein
MEVLESMRLLAHGEAVRRDLRGWAVREQVPGSLALGVGRTFLGMATWSAPLLLVALGYAQSHGVRTPWGEAFRDADVSGFASVLLHAFCLLVLIPHGAGAIRVHEALRMPSRRALLLAQWVRGAPKALYAAIAFGVYQVWFAAEGRPGYGVAWMGCLPFLLGILATWWRVREPSSPECRLTGRLVRASAGVLVLLCVGSVVYAAVAYNSDDGSRIPARFWLYALVPLLLGAAWGLMLVWYGFMGLVSAFRTAFAGGFRVRVVAADVVVLLLFTAAGILFFPLVLAPGVFTGPAGERVLGWTTVLSIALGAWIVHGTLRLHRNRELPARRSVADAGQARLPEEEEKRSSFPPALLRGPAPRCFAAAWAFRRRAAMAPVVPWLLSGFMAFCLWVAIALPGLAWVSVCGVLIYPTYLGFGTSHRLHLLGSGLREQHLQNLRALAIRVALPAAVLCGLFVGLFGPTRERGEVLGLAGAALILRAGVVWFWRVAHRLGSRTGLTPVLLAIVFLPVVPPLLGIHAWFEITFASLTVFYASVGGAGLVLHLAILDERVLLDEMCLEAERR